MNKKKCPLCGAIQTKKNGTRKGVQLWTNRHFLYLKLL